MSNFCPEIKDECNPECVCFAYHELGAIIDLSSDTDEARCTGTILF